MCTLHGIYHRKRALAMSGGEVSTDEAIDT